MITALYFIVPFCISILATPVVIRLNNKLGLIDDPKKNTHEKVIHTYPVPRGGGLAIFISFALSSLVLLPTDKYLIAIIISSILIIIVGILDDKIDINPYVRIFTNFIAALLPIAVGIGIAYVSHPLGGVIGLSQPQISFELMGHTRNIWLISDLLALFWIIFLMNTLNTSANGVDGQLAGVAVSAGIIVSLSTFITTQEITAWPILGLSLITTGAFAGFWPYSFFPQKIMPGYSGATLAGFLFAVMSILSTAKFSILFVVLSVPIIDAIYAIIRRTLSGRSPLSGDREHIHHKMLDAGMSKRSVALIYFFSSLLLGLITLNLSIFGKLLILLLVVVSLVVFILWSVRHRLPIK